MSKFSRKHHTSAYKAQKPIEGVPNTAQNNSEPLMGLLREKNFIFSSPVEKPPWRAVLGVKNAKKWPFWA